MSAGDEELPGGVPLNRYGLPDLKNQPKKLIQVAVIGAASLGAVSTKLSGWRLMHYRDIMDKPQDRLTTEDIHFLLRCIGYSYDWHSHS